MQVALCIHGFNQPWMGKKKNLIPETSKKQNLNLPGADNYLVESESGEWKSWLKAQHSEN